MIQQNLVSKIEEIEEQEQEEQIYECYDCHEYEFISFDNGKLVLHICYIPRCIMIFSFP
jgi:hypothetical protein